MTNSVRDPIVPGDARIVSGVSSDSHSLKISELTEALDQKRLNSESGNRHDTETSATE